MAVRNNPKQTKMAIMTQNVFVRQELLIEIWCFPNKLNMVGQPHENCAVFGQYKGLKFIFQETGVIYSGLFPSKIAILVPSKQLEAFPKVLNLQKLRGKNCQKMAKLCLFKFSRKKILVETQSHAQKCFNDHQFYTAYLTPLGIPCL